MRTRRAVQSLVLYFCTGKIDAGIICGQKMSSRANHLADKEEVLSD